MLSMLCIFVRLKMLLYDVFWQKWGGGSKPQRPISLQRQRPVFFRMLPSSVKIFGKYAYHCTETSHQCYSKSVQELLIFEIDV